MTPEILNWDKTSEYKWKNEKNGTAVRVREDGILHRVEVCDAHGNKLKEIERDTNRQEARKKAVSWMQSHPYGHTVPNQ